jgi:murein DD-endopeptidase MepM/ murein hydrolase activator NlpD
MIDATALAGLARTAPDTPDKAASPEEVGRQAEAMFARMLLKEVRKAMPEEGLLGGRESAMWQDLMDETLAERIAEGGHLGLADQLARELGGTPTVPTTHAVRPHRHGREVHGAPTHGRITSHFGHRSDPFHGRRKFHSGIDIGAPAGTPIQAVRPGRVVFAGEAGTYGNLVVVEHADGLETRYAHARDVHVRVGQRVGRGESLGTVGSTGRSTGPHLHFEVRRGGRAVDPLPFLSRP